MKPTAIPAAAETTTAEWFFLCLLGVLTIALCAFVAWTTRQLWRTNVENLPPERQRDARLFVGAGIAFGLLVFVATLIGSLGARAAVVLVALPVAISFAITAVRLGRKVGRRER